MILMYNSKNIGHNTKVVVDDNKNVVDDNLPSRQQQGIYR